MTWVFFFFFSVTANLWRGRKRLWWDFGQRERDESWRQGPRRSSDPEWAGSHQQHGGRGEVGYQLGHIISGKIQSAHRLISHQRMREEMEEITQQQLVHDKYCKELMGFGTKPRHITPFTSFQSVQPQQSNALLGLLGYSTPQGFPSFGATPAPAKSSLVESRYCRELMEERFDQVGFNYRQNAL